MSFCICLTPQVCSLVGRCHRSRSEPAPIPLSPNELTPPIQPVRAAPAQGWVCPKCGEVNGPQARICMHCRPRGKIEWTCATTTTGGS